MEEATEETENLEATGADTAATAETEEGLWEAAAAAAESIVLEPHLCPVRTSWRCSRSRRG